ncbi:hypothetical protein G7Y89_g13268 [Cudoniella acicularis]|uniref:NAD(P)-binding protein n=1 Tax=Cudoniella acicularis TaxID=354080 RepID=A0A8H4R7R1_9HELO|nr:hypothetical protein G7Y89_g13268 [Cudoniella acicularis]
MATFSSLLSITSTLGYLSLTALLFKLTTSLTKHFLLPSTLPAYLHTSPTHGKPWALVTGTTSGLGHAISHQLTCKGFNILLHGRNATKLQELRETLQAEFPEREIEILVLDATTCFSPITYEISRAYIETVTRGKNITLLINNVGVGHNLSQDFRPLGEFSNVDIDVLLNSNIGFMTHLTHLLLPVLERSAPALVLNIGSMASIGMPYLAVYSGTKSYMEVFSKALDAEMRAEGKGGVKIECMVFGDVDTPIHAIAKEKRNLSVLTAEEAAKDPDSSSFVLNQDEPRMRCLKAKVGRKPGMQFLIYILLGFFVKMANFQRLDVTTLVGKLSGFSASERQLAIEDIVVKSGGQFRYVKPTINFLALPWSRPLENRLKKLQEGGDQPFFEDFRSIAEAPDIKVHILFVSRPEGDLKKQLDGVTALDVKGRNQADIRFHLP